MANKWQMDLMVPGEAVSMSRTFDSPVQAFASLLELEMEPSVREESLSHPKGIFWMIRLTKVESDAPENPFAERVMGVNSNMIDVVFSAFNKAREALKAV